MNWYALFVESGKEEYVEQWLRYYFDQGVLYSVVPKRRVPEKKGGKVYHVLRKMFPGYVLINTEMSLEKYYTIKKIPSLYRVLNNSNDTYYSEIDEREISLILKLIGDSDVVDYSKVYIVNSRVVVKSGPLQGIEGIIRKVDKRKNRAKILLNFLGKQTTIDVGVEVLQSLK